MGYFARLKVRNWRFEVSPSCARSKRSDFTGYDVASGSESTKAHSKARVFRKHESTFERTSIQKARKHTRKYEYYDGEEGKERGKELLLGRWPWWNKLR